VREVGAGEGDEMKIELGEGSRYLPLLDC